MIIGLLGGPLSQNQMILTDSQGGRVALREPVAGRADDQGNPGEPRDRGILL